MANRMNRVIKAKVMSVALVVLTALIAGSAWSQESAFADRPQYRYFGIQLSSATLSGAQPFRISDGTSSGAPHSINNSDVFQAPLGAALAFGLKPEGSDLYGFGEIGYFSMKLKDQVDVSGVGVMKLTGDDVSMYCLKAGLALYLNDIMKARWVPSLGVIGSLGTQHVNVSTYSYSAFSIGPMVALDFRMTDSLSAPRFLALHGEVEYNRSFTDGWPDMLMFAVGLRYFWR
jgi:hypothetical protein